jgi:hypothetical protein
MTIRIFHVLTFATLCAWDNFISTLFQQQVPKVYCLSFFFMLSKFEPFRLATRHEHDELGRGTDSLLQNIRLEVRQHTDTCILREQNQSRDTMKTSSRELDPGVGRLSRFET